MSTPFNSLLNTLAQQARPNSEELLRKGFAQPKLAARQELADRLKAHLAHWREPAGEEIWQELEKGLSEAVESGDVTRLLGIVTQIEGRQPQPKVDVDLTVQVSVGADVPKGAGDVVASFSSFRGDRRDVVARAPLADGEGTLHITRMPREEVWNVLPVELGGPFNFALGWIGVESAGDGTEQGGGALVGYDKHHRLLAMRGTFPVEGVRAFIERTGLPEGADAAEIESMLVALGKLEGPVAFAYVESPTRSLMGFEPTEARAATVSVGPWPPEHF